MRCLGDFLTLNVKKSFRQRTDLPTQYLQPIWTTGCFPSSLREATIIPIPKTQKNLTDPANDWRVVLTSYAKNNQRSADLGVRILQSD